MTSCNLKVKVATRIYLRLNVWTIEQYRANCSNWTDTAFHGTYSCYYLNSGLLVEPLRLRHLKSTSKIVFSPLLPSQCSVFTNCQVILHIFSISAARQEYITKAVRFTVLHERKALTVYVIMTLSSIRFVY